MITEREKSRIKSRPHSGSRNGACNVTEVERLLSPPRRIGAISVREAGIGTDLILVHGGSGSWTHWISNIRELMQHFRLYLVDLPGFGTAPEAQLDDDAYLENVANAFMHLVNNTFHIAAFSFGAAVSAAVANRLGSYLKAMTLIGPAGFGRPEGRRLHLRTVPDFESKPDENAAALAHNLGQVMLSYTPDTSDPVVVLHRRNITQTRFDSRRFSHKNSLLDDMANLARPLQLIWGENDALAYPSLGARMEACQAARPDAELVVVPRAGHWTQFESPNIINKMLIQFHKG